MADDNSSSDEIARRPAAGRRRLAEISKPESDDKSSEFDMSELQDMLESDESSEFGNKKAAAVKRRNTVAEGSNKNRSIPAPKNSGKKSTASIASMKVA